MLEVYLLSWLSSQNYGLDVTKAGKQIPRTETTQKVLDKTTTEAGGGGGEHHIGHHSLLPDIEKTWTLQKEFKLYTAAPDGSVFMMGRSSSR